MNTLLHKFPRYQITTMEWICDFFSGIASFFLVQFAALTLTIYAVRSGLSLDINTQDILIMDSTIASAMYSFFLMSTFFLSLIKLMNALTLSQFLSSLTNRLVNPLFVSCGLIALKYLGVTSLTANMEAVFTIFAISLLMAVIKKPVTEILFRRARRMLANDEGAIRMAYESSSYSTWEFRNSLWLYTLRESNMFNKIGDASKTSLHQIEVDKTKPETTAGAAVSTGIGGTIGSTKLQSSVSNDCAPHGKRFAKSNKKISKSARAKKAKHNARRNRSKQRHI